MKLPILLSVLLLSASPAVAQDIVVLECDLTAYSTVIDAQTSDVVDSWKDEETKVFKIDLKNKTIDGWRDTPDPVEIRDGEVIYKAVNDDGTFNTTMKFNPPGELLGALDLAMVVDGTKYNVIMRVTGSCKRANQ